MNVAWVTGVSSVSGKATGAAAKRAWIVAAILLTGCLGPPRQLQSVPAVQNDDIRSLGLALLARVGVDDYERAAFIAINSDGSLRLIEWPWTHRFRSTEWNGPFPSNVVGIIHTHPRRIPLPSDDDIRTAMRLKIPVLALTPRSLCAATASGEVLCAAMPQR